MIGVWVWGLACATPAALETDVVLLDGAVRVVLPQGAKLPEGTIEVDDGRRWLTLRVAGGETGQPVLGSYARHGDELVFTPRFAIQPGTLWEATWRPPGAEAQVVSLETAAAHLQPPPELLRLEPGVDEVPANLLKVTLTFSTPMRGGLDVTEHIHLVDLETGERDRLAWYKTELWGPDRERLTLLLHPGRTKTGLSFNRDFGPVLIEGGRYRVDVTTGLVDLAGQPLVAPFSWTFAATAPDHTRPLPEDWVLTAPTKPQEALWLALDEPMDGWLLEQAFEVLDAHGAPVDGTLLPSPDATAVGFTPTAPWTPGVYTLHQTGKVEDRAGNTPDRIFDGPADEVKRQGPIPGTWRFEVL